MDDETRAWLEDLLGDPAPADVVGGRELSLEALRDLNSLVGIRAVVTTPGEVVADVDGIPAGVGEPTSEPADVAGAVIHARDLARIRHPRFPDGMSVADARVFYPNLTFYDPEEGHDDC